MLRIRKRMVKSVMSGKLKLKGHLKHLARWPLYLSVLLIALNILVYVINIKAGAVVTMGNILYLVAAVAILLYHRPLLFNDLIAFASQYEFLEKRVLEELALPYAVMDMQGRMIWSNRMFARLTGKDSFYHKNVSTLFPDITADKLPGKDGRDIAELSTQFGDRIYRISMQKMMLGESVAPSKLLMDFPDTTSLIAMYLYDETELKEYIQANEDNKLVVALAYLDNYEEALESVEDVRRSLLIALIDRKITKYFSNYDGLVRKLEKDKYVDINKLVVGKFKISDLVPLCKSIQLFNEIEECKDKGVIDLFDDVREMNHKIATVRSPLKCKINGMKSKIQFFIIWQLICFIYGNFFQPYFQDIEQVEKDNDFTVDSNLGLLN